MTGRLDRIFLAVVALLALSSGVGAQSLSAVTHGCLGTPAPDCQRFTVSIELSDVKVRGSTVGLAVGPDGVALSLSDAETFGPLGNVVFELDGELRAGPVARARLSARGVIASVAARVAVSAAGADAERFDPLAVASGDAPLLGGPTYGLQLGGTFRLSRATILDVAPSVYLSPGGLALSGGATLRLLRALGPNELRAELHAASLPGGAADHVSIGAGVSLPRGRAPDWLFGAWLGYGSTGLLPGVSLQVAEDLGGDARVSLDAAYQPYRLDVRPLRASAGLEVDLAGPTLRLDVASGALHVTAPDVVAARLAVSWPLDDLAD